MIKQNCRRALRWNEKKKEDNPSCWGQKGKFVGSEGLCDAAVHMNDWNYKILFQGTKQQCKH